MYIITLALYLIFLFNLALYSISPSIQVQSRSLFNLAIYSTLPSIQLYHSIKSTIQSHPLVNLVLYSISPSIQPHCHGVWRSLLGKKPRGHGTRTVQYLTSTYKADKDTMAASVPITQGMNNNSRGVVKTVILRL